MDVFKDVDANEPEERKRNSESNMPDVKSMNYISGSYVKYQLRPRCSLARRLSALDWSFDESTGLKSRSSTLSRYRRKTANARERYRMRQINTAFDSLRGVLPSWVCSRRVAADMTKVTTLRLASAYIRSLQNILDGSAPKDTYTWVLSTILDCPSSMMEEMQKESPSTNHTTNVKSSCQSSEVANSPTESDFVSVFCYSSRSQPFEDNFTSLLNSGAERGPTLGPWISGTDNEYLSLHD